MPRLPIPDIPPGNLLYLYQELHELHARASWPSTRVIAKSLSVSHATVYTFMTGARSAAPRVDLLSTIVEVLAKRVRNLDVEGELDSFDKMWLAAHARPLHAPLPDLKVVTDASGRQTVRVRFVRPDSESELEALVAVDFPARFIVDELHHAGFYSLRC